MVSLLFSNGVRLTRRQLKFFLVSTEIFDSHLLRCPLYLSSKTFSAVGQRGIVVSQEQQNHSVPPLAAPHIPVMAEEVLEFLALRKDEVILDMTFGGGGHSRKILESTPDVRMVCLDRDPAAYEYARELQKEYPGRVFPLLGRFRYDQMFCLLCCSSCNGAQSQAGLSK